ncbi:MAG: hypothetical protein GWP91_07815 [Rhodobacterales bacterium]|nr:hypothetical protein [Rhodobacterales bacterium]
MSLFSKIGKSVKGAASSALSRGQEQNQGVSGWGNGFLASLSDRSGKGPDNTGSFSESIFDMTRQLGQSGAGTNEMWGGNGGTRQMSNWGSTGLGLGGILGASDISDRAQGNDTSIWGGLGLGLGGGEWAAQNTNAAGMTRSSNGFSGGAGVNGQLGGALDLFGEQVSQSAEVYRGVGGNAYGFNQSAYTDADGVEHAGSQGYGVDANYTPLGINNAQSAYQGRMGSGGSSVENAVLGKMSGSGEISRSDDGTVTATGAFSPGRTEVHNAEAHFDSALGHTEASLGSFGTGPQYQGNFSVNPETGSFGGGAQWAGDGMKFNDGAVSHDFGNGTTVDGSFGEISTANDWAYNAGWDNETNTLSADAHYATGNTVTDVNVGLNSEYGGINGHLGEYKDGVDINGEMSVGPDGLHATGHGSGGGFQVSDADLAYGQEGVYYQQAHLDHFSTRTEVQGGSLDIDGNGVAASVESVRTGGFRMGGQVDEHGNKIAGLTGHSDILGMTTDYSVGEISNDIALTNAFFNVNGDGVDGGFEELDFGGIRVSDVNVDADLGALGQGDAHLGAFSNGNNIKGAQFSASGDGLNVSAEAIGIMGMDIADLGGNYQGPGGLHASAQMDKLHTGLGVNGFNASLDRDGLDVHADNVNYNALELGGVDLNAGVDGVYDASLGLDHGSFNSFNADNVNVGLDKNGLAVSGDNVSYSYLAAEGLTAETNYFDGAVGTNLSLGKGSFGAGHADHISYDTNIMESNLEVENLNAHGLQLEDVAVGANIGDARADVGADQLNVLDLNVGHAEAHSQAFGTAGQANVQDARLDLLNVEGGNAMLSYGGQDIVGASGDYRAAVGVANADLDYDLLEGRASGSFEDANVSSQLSNASVNFMGSEYEVPDMGYDVHASGQGNVDLMSGTAAASATLAGSSMNFAGYELEVGDWAQASAGVDITQGAVNANIGGDNGVGVDASLADMNLDLNLFGMDIDVDEGISDAAGAVADVASDAWDGISSGASYVASLLPSFSLW